MIKDRLISEACDFGVVYSLFLKQAARVLAPRRVIVKISWEIGTPSGEPETHSCVFEVNVSTGRMWALGRKGNQLPVERFCAAKICAWARRELLDYDSN
jgi:hypothetical protein